MTEFTNTMHILTDVSLGISAIDVTVSKRESDGVADVVEISVNVPLYPKCVKSRPSFIDRVRKAWSVLIAKPDSAMSRTVTISHGSEDIRATLMQCIRFIDGD